MITIGTSEKEKYLNSLCDRLPGGYWFSGEAEEEINGVNWMIFEFMCLEMPDVQIRVNKEMLNKAFKE